LPLGWRLLAGARDAALREVVVMSLRRRLLLGLLTIAAVLVVTNLTLSNRFERFLLDRIDRQLTEVSSSALFRDERPQRPGERGPRPDDQTLSEYYLAVGVPERTLVRVGSSLGDDAHVVRRAGQVVDLSPTEYNLLRFLLLNAGKVLSRNQILDHVWQYDFGGHATVVETYISYLRKKLDKLGPPLIQTVRGVGYSLRAA
jgi:DNA-binding response OmpR family regulator